MEQHLVCVPQRWQQFLKDIEKMIALLNSLQLDHKQKEKVNELRIQCKNDTI